MWGVWWVKREGPLVAAAVAPGAQTDGVAAQGHCEGRCRRYRGTPRGQRCCRRAAGEGTPPLRRRDRGAGDRQRQFWVVGGELGDSSRITGNPAL